ALHEPIELLDGLRAVLQHLAEPGGRGAQLALGDPLLAEHADVPRTPALTDGGFVAPVLAARDHVDRRAHQARLDDAAVLEGLRQRAPPEVREARPEAH